MFRVTPDTNVLISAAIAEGNEYELLKNAKLGKIKIILSPQILKEFKDVISRPKFSFSSEQIEAVLSQLLNISEIVMPTTKLSAVKEDLTDNKILECALYGRADYIVSGDNHLLNLNEFKSIKIINAAKFLEVFAKVTQTEG